jgi:hypothetical protein
MQYTHFVKYCGPKIELIMITRSPSLDNYTLNNISKLLNIKNWVFYPNYISIALT